MSPNIQFMFSSDNCSSNAILWMICLNQDLQMAFFGLCHLKKKNLYQRLLFFFSISFNLFVKETELFPSFWIGLIASLWYHLTCSFNPGISCE